MSKRKIALVLTFVAGMFAYLFTEASYAFALIIGSAIYALAGYSLAALQGKKINLAIGGTDEASKDIEYEISVSAENIGFIPLFSGDVIIGIENLLTGEKSERICQISVMPRGKSEMTIKVTNRHCGIMRITAERLSVFDPLRIFCKTRKLRASKEYCVFPKISEVEVFKEGLNKYDMESYKYSEIKKGSDQSEPFGIKEYEAGDSIKSIHWKLSGKLGSVMVRIPSLPVENSLTVILDNRIETAGAENKECGVGNEKRACYAEHCVESFLSLSNELQKQGVAHNLAWYDRRGENFESVKVTGSADIYVAMPSLLSSSFAEDKMTSVERFLEADAEKKSAFYLYVSGSLEAENDMERLKEYGEVGIYRPYDLD